MEGDRLFKLGRGAAAVIVVAVLGLLAGCGGDGGGDENAGDTVEGTLGLEEEGIIERQKRAENLIGPCMQRQGFRYIPVDPETQQAELVGSRGLTPEEFNEQFGYGITTLFEKRLQQSASGPNQEIYDALSDADKAAYDRALYGDDKTATFAVALDTGDFTGLGGCLKEAADEVFGGAELIQDITGKLDELDNEILEDSRMVDAVQNWSDCMGDEGYDLGTQDEVDTLLENKLEAIVGPVEEVKVPAPGAQPDYDTAALTALQQEEVAVVKLDIACEEEHITSIEEEVRAEYETEFRDKNAALMERVPKA